MTVTFNIDDKHVDAIKALMKLELNPSKEDESRLDIIFESAKTEPVTIEPDKDMEILIVGSVIQTLFEKAENDTTKQR